MISLEYYKIETEIEIEIVILLSESVSANEMSTN